MRWLCRLLGHKWRDGSTPVQSMVRRLGFVWENMPAEFRCTYDDRRWCSRCDLVEWINDG